MLLGLEPEVGKSAVGLRHLMGVVTLLDGVALAVGGFLQLRSERLDERNILRACA